MASLDRRKSLALQSCLHFQPEETSSSLAQASSLWAADPEACEGKRWLQLTNHPHGNFVVQLAIRMATPDVVQLLAEALSCPRSVRVPGVAGDLGACRPVRAGPGATG